MLLFYVVAVTHYSNFLGLFALLVVEICYASNSDNFEATVNASFYRPH